MLPARTYQNHPRQKDVRKFLRRQATTAEKILWKFVRRDGLGYTFRRQFGIGHFIVDFYCHSLRLVIELDGFTHDSEKTQEKDRVKQEFLEKSGYTVIRFTNEEVYGDIEKLLNKIQDACKERSLNLNLARVA
jgi:very-short-patch-repair endonuclease